MRRQIDQLPGMQRKYILAGGSGFLGQALGRRLRERGHEVVILTRSRPRRRGDGIREVQWNPEGLSAVTSEPGRTSNPVGYLSGEEWMRELEGAAAVVNLAGKSVDCVPTAENRRAILQTRIDSVRALGAAMEACNSKPGVWVQAGAVGFYGDAGDERCDENAPAGNDAMAAICRDWEEAFTRACPSGVRPVLLRIGVVLGRKGGAFPEMAKAARMFAGGAAGSGRQGISWIHQTDMEEIFLRAADDVSMSGTFNAAAPVSVSNAEFMGTLRQVLQRPWSPPVPAPLMRLVLRWVVRTDPALVLDGQFVVPARLEAAGYRFRFERLPLALADLVDRRG